MDINNLHTFVTVAELGSFSLAAEQLFLSQPAISKRIHQLEQTLDCKLFDRIGRSIVLTPSGETLFKRARQILLEVDDVKRAISNQNQNISGTLTIGTSHHIALHRLPPLLKQFHQQYPEVELDLSFKESETIYQQVEHGDLEFGIATLPQRHEAKLESIEVWDDPLEFVLAEDIALSGMEPIRQLPAILPQHGTYTRELIEQACNDNALAIDARMSTNNLETILMLVKAGFGWSALPQTMMTPGLQKFDPGFRLTRKLGIIVHKERTLSNAGTHLMQMIRNAG